MKEKKWKGKQKATVTSKQGRNILRKGAKKFAKDVMMMEKALAYDFYQEQVSENEWKTLLQVEPDNDDLKKRITECRERRIAIAGELRRTLEGIMPYVFPRLSTTSSTGEDEEYKELLEALGKNKDDNSKTKEQAGDIQQA